MKSGAHLANDNSRYSGFPAWQVPHWRKDCLLGDIDLSGIDWISIDVFDTLLMRRCHRPVDIFDIVGRRLREMKLIADHLSAEAFRHVRIIAESEARERRKKLHGDTEIDLDDIYQSLDHLIPDCLLAAEVDLLLSARWH